MVRVSVTTRVRFSFGDMAGISRHKTSRRRMSGIIRRIPDVYAVFHIPAH